MRILSSFLFIFTAMWINPDKYIRKAYIAKFANVGVPVYTKKVPASVNPVPQKYILLSTQTKQRTVETKDGFEWLTQITIDMVIWGAKGFSETDKLDDIEGLVINAVESGILVDGFSVKSTDLISSQPLDSETDTQSIERKILIYEHWLSQED